MKHKLIFSLLAFIIIGTPVWAQKPKDSTKKTDTPTTQLSNAEKMGYERSNKYWGPGTYYCYAPGNPNNKMVNNSLTALRDITGISREDFYTEIDKQGFVEVPKTKKKTWYKETKGYGERYFYSPDKSYIIQPGFADLYYSPVKENGEYAYASNGVDRWILIPKEDSLKVIEAIWQFVRELKELDLVLGTFGSNFKNADPKAYPIQRLMSAGWTGLRAGSWVLRTVDGKLQGHWGNNEEILRRTIGMSEFHFVTIALEKDFNYALLVNLTKDGYVLRYIVGAFTINTLSPGNNWKLEYPRRLQEYKNGVDADKNAVELYKKSPFPPVLQDLDKLLHLK